MPRPRRLTALHAIPDHGTPRLARRPRASSLRAKRGHCCRDNPHANGHAGAASTLARARQMNVRPTPRRSSPSTPASLAGVTEAARTRQQARHAMKSGIAGRADAGTQARQFNATPTPATAPPRDPRPWPSHALRAGAARDLGASLANECRAHPSERQPQSTPAQPVGITERWDENGTDAHRGCLSSKPRARTRQQGTSRHEVRDRGEGRRRGASPAI
ncbi:hypothetical protein OIU74_026181 [Salix koriyanagi]|uniref:Uncharacterized protein n=1 Tax=Salix koriyanagi TaxID=2511006 RepID=A0A9Q0W0L5_9ROSI|nr:hypothetical protein OIU74_026181 [Salix koriyanagi]